MSPGLVELMDDAAHLVIEGQTDHAEGEDACPEHGCTPSSHHCGCCTSVAMAAPSAVLWVRGASLALRQDLPGMDRVGPTGVRVLIERPPDRLSFGAPGVVRPSLDGLAARRPVRAVVRRRA